MPGFQGHIAKSVVVKNVGHANPKVSSLVEVEGVALARTWELIIMMIFLNNLMIITMIKPSS